MIKFIDTTFEYDQAILISNFCLEINKGEKVVLHGASGSGKSTLLHAIMGFAKPTSGTILIADKSLTEDSIANIRQLIAWLPQDFSLPFESVREAMLSPFEFKANASHKPNAQTMLHHLSQLGLDSSILDKRLVELSGGQRQRVMLATALLLDKPILLLDEPTSALDASSIKLMIDYLKLWKDLTMVAVSHDVGFIQAFDRNILVDKSLIKAETL